MFSIIKNNIIKSNNFKKRHVWQWLNIIFNKVDENRLKLYGPDRTCAEWLLRNGAAVMWTTETEFLKDYNALPSEDVKLIIKEVDATDSSISHYGFAHFSGCKHIDKIVLHRCIHLEDKALALLEAIRDSLKYLQVTDCQNVTEIGLNSLTKLDRLEMLILRNFPYLQDEETLVKKLKLELPKCNIQFTK